MSADTTAALANALRALRAGGLVDGERDHAVRARLERAGRTHSEAGLLVVGIVGPNNAGKSALFTALSQTAHSPSDPRGGATSQLRAVAAPTVLEHARRALPPLAGEDSEIAWAAAPALPDHLVLVDSPDFDSTATRNHTAAAWMLRAADLLVVVVTKNTYANAAVRTWLEEATARGRPYLLVHNESPSAEIARDQLRDMVAHARFAPRSTWFALHDLDVAAGRAPLAPSRLEIDIDRTPAGRPTPSAEHLTLAALPDRAEAERLVRDARLADLIGLRDALEEALADAEPRVARSTRRIERLEAACASFADAIARAGMPLQPLLRALRAVLDETSSTHGRWRGGVEFVPRMLQGLWSAAGRGVASAFGRGSSSDKDADGAPRGLSRPEAAALGRLLPELTRTLEDIDDNETAATRAARVREALDMLPQALADHEETCRRIVREELAKRGRNDDLQFLASSLATLPLVGSGALFVATGGIGLTDALGAAVLGAGKPVVDAVLDRLGVGLVEKARAAWIATRATALGDAVLAAAMPSATDEARRTIALGTEHLPALRAALASTNERLRALDVPGRAGDGVHEGAPRPGVDVR
jgi:hypothetical protein